MFDYAGETYFVAGPYYERGFQLMKCTPVGPVVKEPK